MTTHEFSVEPRLRLILSDVTATVRVRRGASGTARVELTGPERYTELVSVDFDAAENRLEISEQPVGRVTVVTSGSAVSAGNVVVGSGSVVSGTGAVTVVSTSGERVVVNGVDVTDQVSGGAAEPPPTLTVVVPEGTDTGAERCRDLSLSGVRGRVRAVVTGRGRLTGTEATAGRLAVTGQSWAALRRSSGSVELTVGGQSRAELDGSFGEVRVRLSGQARVTARGDFGRVCGDATGMARLEVHGTVAERDVRTSGMARVFFGGPISGATGDDWDF